MASLVEPEDILVVGPVVIVARGICGAFKLLSRGVVEARMLPVPVAVIVMQLTAASAALYRGPLDRCVVTFLLDTRRSVTPITRRRAVATLQAEALSPQTSFKRRRDCHDHCPRVFTLRN